MFKFSVAIESLKPILTGMPATLGLTFGAVALALVLGILLTFGVKSRLRPVRMIFTVIQSFLKGIPILVLLYLFNTSMDDIMYGLAGIFGFVYDIRRPPTFFFAILAMALSYAPYMCDMITSAMDTVPVGQSEACDAMGFTRRQKMTRIILPQTIVIAIPNFGNHFVNLLKATSLACMVTIIELMGAARNFATMNQRFLEPYLVCALIYWAVFAVFERLFRILEKQTGKYLEPGMIRRRKKSLVIALIGQAGNLRRNRIPGRERVYDSRKYQRRSLESRKNA